MKKTTTTNTTYTVADLANDLDLKVRDTEKNRDLAAKVPDLKSLLGDGWKDAIKTQIEAGLTEAERTETTNLNKFNADLKDAIANKRQTIKKLQQEIETDKAAITANNARIAEIANTAGIETAKPKRGRADTSGLTDEEKRARDLQRKKEWNIRHRIEEKIKAGKPLTDKDLEHAQQYNITV